MKTPCVYIMASGFQGTIYVGVTSDLPEREHQHYMKLYDGFTKKHNVNRLVWFEEFQTMEMAIQREKTIKHWVRDWKVALIEKVNPHWHRLSSETGEFIYDE